LRRYRRADHGSGTATFNSAVIKLVVEAFRVRGFVYQVAKSNNASGIFLHIFIFIVEEIV
jgi:hypothetical protein